MIKPIVGRVVLYMPKMAEMASVHNQPFRADICHVHNDECVNLSINAENGKQFMRDSVTLAQDRDPRPGECYWMDYQLKQAKEKVSSAQVAAAPAVGEYPTVTPADIEKAINETKFIVDGKLTICILTMRNGFKVIGESACVDPRNFDEVKGRTYARENAVEKLWPMMGYALADRLVQAETR